MNMKTFFLLFLLAVPTAAAPHESNAAEPVPATSRVDRVLESDLAVRLVVAGLGVELILLLGTEKGKCILKEHCQPQNLVLNFLHEYLSQWFVTLTHEGGHAGTAYLATGDQVNILVGSSTNPVPYISFGGVGINGLHPLKGRSTYHRPQDMGKLQEKVKKALQVLTEQRPDLQAQLSANPSICSEELREAFMTHLKNDPTLRDDVIDKKKLAAIVAAGGLGGLCANQLRKAILRDGMQLDHIDLGQLFNMLIPYKASNGNLSDGGVLARQCLGMPDKFVEFTSSHMAQYLDLSAELPLFFLHSSKEVRQQLNAADMLGIMLINYGFRSFLRVKA